MPKITNAVEALEFYETHWKEHAVMLYATEHGIDLRNMAETKPILFKIYVSIGREFLNETGIKLWNNYSTAYDTLVATDAIENGVILCHAFAVDKQSNVFGKYDAVINALFGFDHADLNIINDESPADSLNACKVILFEEFMDAYYCTT